MGGQKVNMQQSNHSEINIEPARTALLLLHWQNDFAAQGGKLAGNMLDRLAAAHTIEHTRAVLSATRKKGMLVIYVSGVHRPGHPEMPAKLSPMSKMVAASGACLLGTWGAKVIEQLKPLENEIVIYNHSANAFNYNELDMILRNKNITDLVLTGLATNWIIEGTARDGAGKGYFINVLKDCCESHSDELHNWTLNNILPALGAVIDSDSYIAALQNS
jgi:nicotinamidase-related amidase